MKLYILLTLLLLVTISCFSLSTSFGFINDNYTGTVENGKNGRYLGADDFLTFSFLNITTHNKLSFFTTWKVVTSRKYKYRYDYLVFRTGYDLSITERVLLTPKCGFILKGNLGGETFQNNFHNIRNLPEVNLDYINDEKVGLNLGLDIKYNLVENLNLYLINSFPTDIVPISTNLLFIYSIDFKLLSIDAAIGYKHYINDVQNYNDFVQNGITWGIKLNLPLIYDFSIDSLLYFIPARNLESHESFAEWNHDFSPQIWVGLSYKINKSSFKELLSQY